MSNDPEGVRTWVPPTWTWEEARDALDWDGTVDELRLWVAQQNAEYAAAGGLEPIVVSDDGEHVTWVGGEAQQPANLDHGLAVGRTGIEGEIRVYCPACETQLGTPVERCLHLSEEDVEALKRMIPLLRGHDDED